MKKKSDTITEENYFEWMALIGEDLVKNIVDALQEIYVADYKVVPTRNNVTNNYFSICFYYDYIRSVLYVYYELDRDRIHAVRTPDRLIYNNIFNHIRYTARDYDIRIQIVGTPTSKPEYSIGRDNILVDQENKILRASTRAFWSIEPKGKPKGYFIEATGLLEDDFRLNNTSEDTKKEFFSKVEEINSRYNLPGPDEYTNVLNAFRDFNTLYQEYFNRELPIFVGNKVINIYLNIDHYFDDEKLDPDIHKMGVFKNRAYVSEYILQLANTN